MTAGEGVTLVVRPVRGCDSGCRYCPWEEAGGERVLLPRERMELVVDALVGSGLRPTVCLICPDPLGHPELGELLTAARERGLEADVMVPAKTKSGEGSWSGLLAASRVFVFSYTTSELAGARKLIRYLLMRGSSPEAVAALAPGTGEDEVRGMAGLARRWGIRLRVSPPPFCPLTRCPVDVVGFLKRGGYDVTEPVGSFLEIYEERVAFMGDYPILVSHGPMCRPDCGLILLDADGMVGKCPAGGLLSYLPPPTGIANLALGGCERISEGVRYTFAASIKLVTSDGREVPEGDLELLSLLKEAGSLSAVARMVGLSPASVLKRIRRAEGVLGFRLFVARRGGASRGGASPTPEAP